MSKDRYVWLDGIKVPVSEEVYRAYYRPEWREAKQKDVRGDNEYSLDALEDIGFEAVSPDALVDEIVADKLLLDELYVALAELTDDELSLIDGVYFRDQPFREYARQAGTNHTNVIRQHKRVIDKLRDLLKKYF